MTRPFAVSGLTLFFVMLALSFVSDAKPVMIAGAVCFVLFVCSLLHPKTRKDARLPLCFFSALTGCLLFSAFLHLLPRPGAVARRHTANAQLYRQRLSLYRLQRPHRLHGEGSV